MWVVKHYQPPNIIIVIGTIIIYYNILNSATAVPTKTPRHL